MDHLEQDDRQLVHQVLEAAGRGDQAAIEELVAPLDTDQLRALVGAMATQIDESLQEVDASAPASVCDIAVEASAHAFDVTPEAILSAERSKPVSDARAVAMSVARDTGLSYPAIADHFNKDHASVMHAVRRTAERPRLANAAARISEHVHAHYPAHSDRPSTPTAEEADPVSDYDPSDLVEHAVAVSAEVFGTTPEVLLGPSTTRAAVDERSVAMAAARLHDQSLPRIAGYFDRHQTTVLSATRRVGNTPPLHALAIEIAKTLPEQPADARPGQEHPTAAEDNTRLPSPGADPMPTDDFRRSHGGSAVLPFHQNESRGGQEERLGIGIGIEHDNPTRGAAR